jgi:hypothetical protein
VDIRELGPGDDPGALLDLSVRVFGPLATLPRARLAGWRAGRDPDGDAVLDAAFGADAFVLEFF